MGIDRLDIGILKRLAVNCRVSYESLARDLGVTSTTVKKRINKLIESDRLQGFAVEPNSSTNSANRTLLLIDTNGKEDIDSFADAIGNNQYVECISHLSNDKYLVIAICNDLVDLSHLHHILNQMDCVLSIETHPIINRIQQSRGFTQLQRNILPYLLENPRIRASVIAARLERSTKGVRNAIHRLIKSNGIVFSVRCSFFSFLVKAKVQKEKSDVETVINWLESTFYSIWSILTSAIEDILFVFFAVNDIDEIYDIQKTLQKVSTLVPLEMTIGEPMRYFSAIRKTFSSLEL